MNYKEIIIKILDEYENRAKKDGINGRPYVKMTPIELLNLVMAFQEIMLTYCQNCKFGKCAWHKRINKILQDDKHE